MAHLDAPHPTPQHFPTHLLTALVVMLCLGATVAAERVRVTSTRANVRLHARETSPVMVAVPMGTVLEVTAREGDWLRVALPADSSGFPREGFVASRVVETSEPPVAARPVPTSPAPATPTVAAIPSPPAVPAPGVARALTPAQPPQTPGAVATVAASATRRDTVAVLDFAYGAVRPWWTGTWDIGQGVSDLLVMELVNGRQVRVIERSRLEAILAEQEFSLSDRADPSAAAVAKIGSMLGVRYLIVGSITQFSFEQSGIGIGTGGWTRFIGGVNVVTSKAHVGLTARMIDTSTGEIVGAATAVKKSDRRSVALAGGANGYFSGMAMGSSGFLETVLGEATQNSVEALSAKLVASLQAGAVQTQ